MNQIRSFVAISARILVAILFLMNGFGIVDQSFAIHEMIVRGIPANLVPGLNMAGRVVEIFSGAGLLFGLYPQICAVALIAFLIPATLIAHPFWIEPSKLVQIQLVNFLKNLAIMGGLLCIASASSHWRAAKAERTQP